MRPPARLTIVAIVAVLVAACGGSAGPSPSPSPSPEPPADAFRLRLTATQAIPPLERFGWGSQVVITGDGVLVVPGAVPAIYPGPLVTPLFGRALSDAGWAEVVALARKLAILVDGGTFAGAAPAPGAMLGTVEIFVDGRLITFTGDPSAQIMCITTPCDPPPGTDAAFGEFWRRVSDLASWMPGELGPEGPYLPSGYALLVGPPQAPEAGIVPQVMDWPLDVPLATAGVPVAGSGLRCVEITGDAAATLAPALGAANQLTQWVQDPDTSATFGLRVVPLVAGERPCTELFGAG